MDKLKGLGRAVKKEHQAWSEDCLHENFLALRRDLMCSRKYRFYMMVMYQSGLRIQDLNDFPFDVPKPRTDHQLLAGGHWYLMDTKFQQKKTRKKRLGFLCLSVILPLSFYRKLKGWNGSKLAFGGKLNPGNKPGHLLSWLYFKRKAIKINQKERKEQKLAPRKYFWTKFQTHDLRTSFVTNRLRLFDLKLGDVSKLIGH